MFNKCNWKFLNYLDDFRNVLDCYKGLSNEEIRTQVQAKTLPYAVCMQHMQGDFNISSVIRNANAFGARKVFYYGQKRYDKRGAISQYHYTDVQYLTSLSDLISLKREYTFVGLELTDKAEPLGSFVWPKNPLILIGEESKGLVQEVLDLCDHQVYIPMRGSTRSINAAAAGGVAMYDFMNKF